MWETIQKRFQTTDSFVSLILGVAVVLIIGTLTVNFFTRTKQTKQEAQIAAETKVDSTTLPTKHIVATGETLWSIAETYYKSGYNWVDIRSANTLTDADRIEVGQELTIPQATPIVPQGQVSGTSTAPKVERYTVAQGDTLWSIAQAQYGDSYKWSAIAAANNLLNPEVIHTGNVLTLP